MEVLARGRYERASFLRHIAICVAALAACLLRDQVRAGDAALWILGWTAVTNVGMSFVAERPSGAWASRVLSPCFGLAGWAVLMWLSGGSESPFVAGLWLEIVLSAWMGSPTGTVLVTSGAIAALWLQDRFPVASTTTVPPLTLQTGFLVAMGGVTLLLTRQWARAQRASARRQQELAVRLRSLEGEMEAWRASGVAGEHVAGLAHALKNAIHGLRGFAALIDAPRAGRDAEVRAREGLRAAIERLEGIARAALGSAPAPPPGARLDGPQARRIIEQILDEVSLAHPGIAWRRRIAESLPAVCAEGTALREALLSLAHNAAEAMEGRGAVEVATLVTGDRFEIRVRDHGAGFPEETRERGLSPGFTTKRGGSGFGLFLAKRSLEAWGGRLTIASASDGGAVVSMGLAPGPGGSP